MTLAAVIQDPYLEILPTGALIVNAGAPVGTRTFTYEICEIANSINCANWVSRFLPKPTLPGLIRYFAKASAQAGSAASN